MQLKPLGKTGLFIPEIGLGTWGYHAGPAPLRRGFEAGALFVDTAESYGTEAVVREAAADFPDRVFVATKVSPHNFRRADLRRSVDGSLGRLAVERIDLLQLHEPNVSIPIEETMGAVVELVEAGKIRFVGVSNFSVPQLQAAQKALGRHPIVSNQVRYSIVDRTIEGGLLQFCQNERITVIAYSPLARDFSRIRDCDPSGAIETVARELGKSPAQVALNWCLGKDAVVVIPKGNSEAHILDNCGASGWRLGPEHIHLLDTQMQHRRRGRLDEWVRRFIPRRLERVAVQLLNSLPKELRRRLH